MSNKAINSIINEPSSLHYRMQMLLFALFLLIAVYPQPLHAQASAGLHIVLDIDTELDDLRMISGVLPANLPVQLWAYQNKLTAIKPIYLIDKSRPPLPVVNVRQDNTTNLIDALSLLAEQLKPTIQPQDILLVTRTTAQDVALTSPAIEKLVGKLIATNTRLSALVIGGEPTAPLYELMAHASHGKTKYIDKETALPAQFFDFIDQYTALDYIPLEETLLKVDSHIDEATLILFKSAKDNNAIEVIPPLGKPFTANTAPSNVKWIDTRFFQVIHIEKPALGTWQIYGEDNLNSRVVVRTDLQLDGSFLDSLIEPSRFQTIHFSLKEKGQIVTSPEVMNHLIIKAVQIQDGVEQHSWFPADNGKNGDDTAKDGYFALPLRDTLIQGDYLFKVTVDGAKFQRVLYRHVSVTDQLAWVYRQPSDQEGTQRILIVPYSQLIKPESIIMNASIKNGHSANQYSEIPRANEYTWLLELTQAKSLVINLAGTNHRGDTTSIWLPEINLVNEAPLNNEQAGSLNNLVKKILSESDTESPTAAIAQITHANAQITHEITTFSIGLHLAIANFIAVSLCFFLYKQWQKKESAWQQHLKGRLS